MSQEVTILDPPTKTLAPEEAKKTGKFTLTRRQWTTGFRGIQLAMCTPCFSKFRNDTSKLETTEEGTRLVVDICKKCTMLASRLRFD